jgi:hypothetical protein
MSAAILLPAPDGPVRRELAAFDVERDTRERLAASVVALVDVLETDQAARSPISARTNSLA